MASILVLSDFEEELNTVREQLTDPLGQVTYCHSADEAKDLLLNLQPLLLVLAHSDIATAVTCLTSLRENIPKGQKQNHLTLLLCRSRDVDEAHTCCLNGIFDDYVVNRPLHDPRRIDLSVRQLVARGVSSRQVADIAEPPAPPEVLIVDDDDVYRSILVRIVENAGMRAVECEDGLAALQQLRLRPPAIVLLDQEMPGMTGLDVLQHMRDAPHSAAVPVVMLTGVGTKEVVKDSIARGIQGFIAKPSNAAAIVERIRLVLAKAGAA